MPELPAGVQTGRERQQMARAETPPVRSSTVEALERELRSSQQLYPLSGEYSMHKHVKETIRALKTGIREHSSTNNIAPMASTSSATAHRGLSRGEILVERQREQRLEEINKIKFIRAASERNFQIASAPVNINMAHNPPAGTTSVAATMNPSASVLIPKPRRPRSESTDASPSSRHDDEDEGDDIADDEDALARITAATAGAARTALTAAITGVESSDPQRGDSMNPIPPTKLQGLGLKALHFATDLISQAAAIEAAHDEIMKRQEKKRQQGDLERERDDSHNLDVKSREIPRSHRSSVTGASLGSGNGARASIVDQQTKRLSTSYSAASEQRGHSRSNESHPPVVEILTPDVEGDNHGEGTKHSSVKLVSDTAITPEPTVGLGTEEGNKEMIQKLARMYNAPQKPLPAPVDAQQSAFYAVSSLYAHAHVTRHDPSSGVALQRALKRLADQGGNVTNNDGLASSETIMSALAEGQHESDHMNMTATASNSTDAYASKPDARASVAAEKAFAATAPIPLGSSQPNPATAQRSDEPWLLVGGVAATATGVVTARAKPKGSAMAAAAAAAASDTSSPTKSSPVQSSETHVRPGAPRDNSLNMQDLFGGSGSALSSTSSNQSFLSKLDFGSLDEAAGHWLNMLGFTTIEDFYTAILRNPDASRVMFRFRNEARTEEQIVNWFKLAANEAARQTVARDLLGSLGPELSLDDIAEIGNSAVNGSGGSGGGYALQRELTSQQMNQLKLWLLQAVESVMQTYRKKFADREARANAMNVLSVENNRIRMAEQLRNFILEQLRNNGLRDDVIAWFGMQGRPEGVSRKSKAQPKRYEVLARRAQSKGSKRVVSVPQEGSNDDENLTVKRTKPKKSESPSRAMQSSSKEHARAGGKAAVSQDGHHSAAPAHESSEGLKPDASARDLALRDVTTQLLQVAKGGSYNRMVAQNSLSNLLQLEEPQIKLQKSRKVLIERKLAPSNSVVELRRFRSRHSQERSTQSDDVASGATDFGQERRPESPRKPPAWSNPTVESFEATSQNIVSNAQSQKHAEQSEDVDQIPSHLKDQVALRVEKENEARRLREASWDSRTQSALPSKEPTIGTGLKQSDVSLAGAKTLTPDGALIQDLTYVLAEANRNAELRNTTSRPSPVQVKPPAPEELSDSEKDKYQTVLTELALAERLETARTAVLRNEDSPDEIARVKEGARAVAASAILSGALELKAEDRIALEVQKLRAELEHDSLSLPTKPLGEDPIDPEKLARRAAQSLIKASKRAKRAEARSARWEKFRNYWQQFAQRAKTYSRVKAGEDYELERMGFTEARKESLSNMLSTGGLTPEQELKLIQREFEELEASRQMDEDESDCDEDDTVARDIDLRLVGPGEFAHPTKPAKQDCRIEGTAHVSTAPTGQPLQAKPAAHEDQSSKSTSLSTFSSGESAYGIKPVAIPTSDAELRPYSSQLRSLSDLISEGTQDDDDDDENDSPEPAPSETQQEKTVSEILQSLQKPDKPHGDYFPDFENMRDFVDLSAQVRPAPSQVVRRLDQGTIQLVPMLIPITFAPWQLPVRPVIHPSRVHPELVFIDGFDYGYVVNKSWAPNGGPQAGSSSGTYTSVNAALSMSETLGVTNAVLGVGPGAGATPRFIAATSGSQPIRPASESPDGPPVESPFEPILPSQTLRSIDLSFLADLPSTSIRFHPGSPSPFKVEELVPYFGVTMPYLRLRPGLGAQTSLTAGYVAHPYSHHIPLLHMLQLPGAITAIANATHQPGSSASSHANDQHAPDGAGRGTPLQTTTSLSSQNSPETNKPGDGHQRTVLRLGPSPLLSPLLLSYCVPQGPAAVAMLNWQSSTLPPAALAARGKSSGGQSNAKPGSSNAAMDQPPGGGLQALAAAANAAASALAKHFALSCVPPMSPTHLALCLGPQVNAFFAAANRYGLTPAEIANGDPVLAANEPGSELNLLTPATELTPAAAAAIATTIQMLRAALFPRRPGSLPAVPPQAMVPSGPVPVVHTATASNVSAAGGSSAHLTIAGHLIAQSKQHALANVSVQMKLPHYALTFAYQFSSALTVLARQSLSLEEDTISSLYMQARDIYRQKIARKRGRKTSIEQPASTPTSPLASHGRRRRRSSVIALAEQVDRATRSGALYDYQSLGGGLKGAGDVAETEGWESGKSKLARAGNDGLGSTADFGSWSVRHGFDGSETSSISEMRDFDEWSGDSSLNAGATIAGGSTSRDLDSESVLDDEDDLLSVLAEIGDVDERRLFRELFSTTADDDADLDGSELTASGLDEGSASTLDSLARDRRDRKPTKGGRRPAKQDGSDLLADSAEAPTDQSSRESRRKKHRHRDSSAKPQADEDQEDEPEAPLEDEQDDDEIFNPAHLEKVLGFMTEDLALLIHYMGQMRRGQRQRRLRKQQQEKLLDQLRKQRADAKEQRRQARLKRQLAGENDSLAVEDEDEDDIILDSEDEDSESSVRAKLLTKDDYSAEELAKMIKTVLAKLTPDKRKMLLNALHQRQQEVRRARRLTRIRERIKASSAAAGFAPPGDSDTGSGRRARRINKLSLGALPEGDEPELDGLTTHLSGAQASGRLSVEQAPHAGERAGGGLGDFEVTSETSEGSLGSRDSWGRGYDKEFISRQDHAPSDADPLAASDLEDDQSGPLSLHRYRSVRRRSPAPSSVGVFTDDEAERLEASMSVSEFDDVDSFSKFSDTDERGLDSRDSPPHVRSRRKRRLRAARGGYPSIKHFDERQDASDSDSGDDQLSRSRVRRLRRRRDPRSTKQNERNKGDDNIVEPTQAGPLSDPVTKTAVSDAESSQGAEGGSKAKNRRVGNRKFFLDSGITPDEQADEFVARDDMLLAPDDSAQPAQGSAVMVDDPNATHTATDMEFREFVSTITDHTRSLLASPAHTTDPAFISSPDALAYKSQLQQRIVALWNFYVASPKERLDFIARYSSAAHAHQLGPVLSGLEIIAKAIVVRERLIGQLDALNVVSAAALFQPLEYLASDSYMRDVLQNPMVCQYFGAGTSVEYVSPVKLRQQLHDQINLLIHHEHHEAVSQPSPFGDTINSEIEAHTVETCVRHGLTIGFLLRHVFPYDKYGRKLSLPHAQLRDLVRSFRPDTLEALRKLFVGDQQSTKGVRGKRQSADTTLNPTNDSLAKLSQLSRTRMRTVTKLRQLTRAIRRAILALVTLYEERVFVNGTSYTSRMRVDYEQVYMCSLQQEAVMRALFVLAGVEATEVTSSSTIEASHDHAATCESLRCPIPVKPLGAPLQVSEWTISLPGDLDFDPVKHANDLAAAFHKNAQLVTSFAAELEKRRQLLRAGGEVEKHMHQDGPHDDPEALRILAQQLFSNHADDMDILIKRVVMTNAKLEDVDVLATYAMNRLDTSFKALLQWVDSKAATALHNHLSIRLGILNLMQRHGTESQTLYDVDSRLRYQDILNNLDRAELDHLIGKHGKEADLALSESIHTPRAQMLGLTLGIGFGLDVLAPTLPCCVSSRVLIRVNSMFSGMSLNESEGGQPDHGNAQSKDYEVSGALGLELGYSAAAARLQLQARQVAALSGIKVSNVVTQVSGCEAFENWIAEVQSFTRDLVSAASAKSTQVITPLASTLSQQKATDVTDLPLQFHTSKQSSSTVTQAEPVTLVEHRYRVMGAPDFTSTALRRNPSRRASASSAPSEVAAPRQISLLTAHPAPQADAGYAGDPALTIPKSGYVPPTAGRAYQLPHIAGRFLPVKPIPAPAPVNVNATVVLSEGDLAKLNELTSQHWERESKQRQGIERILQAIERFAASAREVAAIEASEAAERKAREDEEQSRLRIEKMRAITASLTSPTEMHNSRPQSQASGSRPGTSQSTTVPSLSHTNPAVSNNFSSTDAAIQHIIRSVAARVPATKPSQSTNLATGQAGGSPAVSTTGSTTANTESTGAASSPMPKSATHSMMGPAWVRPNTGTETSTSKPADSQLPRHDGVPVFSASAGTPSTVGMNRIALRGAATSILAATSNSRRKPGSEGAQPPQTELNPKLSAAQLAARVMLQNMKN